MFDAGHSKLVLCENLEGGGGEGGWRGVQDEGDTWVSMANSCSCMAKTITLL